MIYTLRRLNLLIITLLILICGSYGLAFLFPGEAYSNITGISSFEQQEELSLFGFIQDTLSGNWGNSLVTGKPVFEQVMSYLPASLELGFYALSSSLIIGIPLGLIAGLKHRSGRDYNILGLSLVGFSLPIFWLALLLILVFGLQTGQFPVSGRISLLHEVPIYSGFMLVDILVAELPNKAEVFGDAIRHLTLPSLSLAIVTSALIIRMVRRSMINVMDSDFIKAAYTKGLSNLQVFWYHGIKNALLPILPQLAMQFTLLLTNAMIVEVIFSWPGIGEWIIQAINQRDYPAIRGGVLAVSSLVVIFTIGVELIVRLFYPISNRQHYGQV